MNTVDLVNKVAVQNALTLGRAEMIFNIIIERMIDNIRTGNSVSIPGFGTFNVISQSSGAASHGYGSSSGGYHISFSPDANFLNVVNG